MSQNNSLNINETLSFFFKRNRSGYGTVKKKIDRSYPGKFKKQFHEAPNINILHLLNSLRDC
ncbi:hypothetical protein D0809_11865 [Flavobacterium circumlabens]|uniref:Uncharacterized protein n=1 Tax=Flavobacterium circumlabens TaxID=2133765 RepID=A0A4Y7UDI0_9FLAO|nr:hypothetical protein D0809_11865 [Flavobacterium circumlabens]